MRVEEKGVEENGGAHRRRWRGWLQRSVRHTETGAQMRRQSDIDGRTVRRRQTDAQSWMYRQNERHLAKRQKQRPRHPQRHIEKMQATQTYVGKWREL